MTGPPRGVIRRGCTVCGALAVPGTSRCLDHPPGTGRLPRSCADCGVRTAANRCGPCQAAAEERLRDRQPWRREYGTKAHRSAREKAMERAGGRCEDCGRRAGAICRRHDPPRIIKLQADHVIELSEGGPNTAANLRVRCACCCHAAKTAAARRARSRRR